MKVTIFFFSGTGNTWFIANTLADALNHKGAESNVVNIENIDMESTKSFVNESDKIVIGFPIYGSTSPRIMQEFIKNLPSTDKAKGISVFTTVGLYSGDGTILYRKALQNKGYKFETGMEFIMSNNLNIPNFPDALHVGDRNKIDKRNAKASTKVLRMAEAIVEGKNILNYDRVFGHMMGGIQRKYVDAWIVKLNSMMFVKHDKCIKCMRCVKMCPADNISFVDGKIEIGANCMACMRCYHFCPTTAVNITEKSLDIKKWPRFQGATKDYKDTLL